MRAKREYKWGGGSTIYTRLKLHLKLFFIIFFFCHSVVEVNTKIKKAYCPPEIVEKNPIVDYVRYIILPYYNKIVINLKVFLFRM